jgi:hypothetical protein
MNTVIEIEGAMNALVSKVPATVEAAAFTISGLRTATAECLADIRADATKFGTSDAEPFWNLLMYDGAPDQKALFVITVFTPELLRLYASEGLPSQVIGLCDQFAMSDVVEMESAFEAQFGLSRNSVDIPRSLAELWLSAR